MSEDNKKEEVTDIPETEEAADAVKRKLRKQRLRQKKLRITRQREVSLRKRRIREMKRSRS